jgi:hypothetical protein
MHVGLGGGGQKNGAKLFLGYKFRLPDRGGTTVYILLYRYLHD